MAESLIQRSFAGGEIAQDLYARADQTKYQTGLKACRNMQVMRHGGVQSRAGSGLVNEVKDSSAKTYFLKFIYNADQTYVIEVGNLYMRFFRNGARIVVSGVAAYNGATAYVLSDLVVQGGVNYYCIAPTTGNAPPNAAFWYALTGTIYEIPTPYVTADIPTIQFQQSADVVTIEHPNYPPKELTRLGHTTWKLQTITFAPSISAPTAPANTGAAGATPSDWVITSVKTESFEESLQSAATTSSAIPTAGAPITVSWVAATGAQEYNVYRKINGVYGYIGVAIGLSFIDTGIIPNVTLTPPIARNPFNATSDYPSTGGYYQQRRLFANTDNNVEKFWGTRSGMTKNLTISSPLQDDDAVTFSISGRQVNEIRHLFDLGLLVILTSSGEWVVEGDQDGVLRANQPPNLKQIGYNGASELVPIVITSSLVYVQARGTIVRDLRNEVQATGGSNYNGRDLTVFAPHLFEGFTVGRWDYSQIPHSIIYAIRSDGVMLGLTYLREHEVWGWHRHDTDGLYEDVVCVPEGNEDAVYVMVNRTINGATKRYIERFASRRYTNIRHDAIFLDSYLTYDGRNTGATTLTLSTGAGWTVDDTITVTAALGTPFVPGDVGNDFVFLNSVGDSAISIRVTAYSSSTVVSGTPSMTVPLAYRGVAYTTWGRAVDQLAGLDHLEAEDVGVFADGNVVANPNNPAYSTITVAVGGITLERPYLVIHVGKPYIVDFETLDLDVNGQQIRGSKKDITHIKLLVKDTRGIFAGPEFPEDIDPLDRLDAANLLEGLDELQAQPVTNYGTPWPSVTGLVTMAIASTWNETGSFVVRQIDPLPMTILAAIPSGEMGGG